MGGRKAGQIQHHITEEEWEAWVDGRGEGGKVEGWQAVGGGGRVGGGRLG